jgi:predicted phosphodiesterase
MQNKIVITVIIIWVVLPLFSGCASTPADGVKINVEKAKGQPEKPLFTFVHLTDTHCITMKSNPGKPPENPYLYFLGIKMNHWKDLANSFDILSETVKYINREIKPDFLIHCGDITDKSGLADMKRAKKILDTLECTYYACQGDHDMAKTGGTYNYVKVFRKRYTSFDREDWHFVMMGIMPADKELNWLEEDLKKNRKKKVVFFTHRLVIASLIVSQAFKMAGVACLMPKAERVTAILKKHENTVMVLSGHVHMNLNMRKKGMDTAFISTDSLGERPHQFKVFRVYEDRIEITLFTGHTAKDIKKGKWTKESMKYEG